MSARIGTLHDARWVLFDDDTRLLFATNFDGDWTVKDLQKAVRVHEAFQHLLDEAS
ncbi:hypothetical protein [Nonomuraea sp. NEAU-A123]|uniref:hypothetical protein n=1 Tax=Nonomuraea sp. NEAU-A123 TaxID=2839649 RepID=UPI001BE49E7E|nr:hypothetical protein [Nonomuraea sp. NEAU-A123]MBT2234295.1 hypothetical protein [Nonomuraea sp. NEAU-A123]